MRIKLKKNPNLNLKILKTLKKDKLKLRKKNIRNKAIKKEIYF